MDTFYDGTKIIKKEEIDAFFKKNGDYIGKITFPFSIS